MLDSPAWLTPLTWNGKEAPCPMPRRTLSLQSVAKAERIVREELEALRWSALELQHRRKGDPEKLKIAQRLRNQTTMTLHWIAQRLHMGSAGHLSHLLYRKPPSAPQGPEEATQNK